MSTARAKPVAACACVLCWMQRALTTHTLYTARHAENGRGMIPRLADYYIWTEPSLITDREMIANFGGRGAGEDGRDREGGRLNQG